MKLYRQPANPDMLKAIRDSLLAPVPPPRFKRTEPVMRANKALSERCGTTSRALSE